MRLKPFFSLSLALAVTVIALTYALWGLDYDELFKVLGRGKYVAVAPFVTGLVVFYWLKALRWTVILVPFGRYSWREVIPAMMIGFASNNVLPGHLGEFVRMWLFARHSRVAMSGVLVSIVLERIFDVVAILVFYTASVLMMESPPEELVTGAWTVMLIVVATCACIAIALWRPAFLFAVYDRLTLWIGGAFRDKGREALQNVVRALGSLQSFSQIALLLVYTFTKWFLLGGLVWLSIWAYGTSISLHESLVVLAVMTLAVTVPSAPGYVGALQAAFVIALTPFGVDEEVAVAASFFFLVAHWVPVTAIGALLFLREGMRVSEMRAAIAADGEA